MAARQSSSLCAPPGLLLLLIGVISSLLPEVQAKPIDFWCNLKTRDTFLNSTTIENLKKDMAGCVGSDTLSSPVQLPCVWMQAAEWANKTPQQKRAEVVGALRMFQDGVQGAMNQTTLPCQTLLLGRLAHHIRNVLLIVNNLQIQNDTETPSHSAVLTCSRQTSLNEVLKRYGNLLRGKLDRLAIDLKGSMCNEEQRTT